MTTHATGTFELQGWDETPYGEIDGERKLTRASETTTFRGDVEGKGTLESLMFYRRAASGSFIGLEHVAGRLGERTGSFVLHHTGTFEGDTVTASWYVVPGSGTGDLEGLRGEGGFGAQQGQRQTPFTLDYELD